MRFLFTAAPLYGHFFPLVPLAWACRSLGHDVLVATADHFVSSAAQSGLPVAPGGPGGGLHELADLDAEHGIKDARYAHGRVFGAMAARNLSTTWEVVANWRPDVIVSERCEFAGPIAAATLGIPFAELRWSVPELAEYRAAAEAVLRPRLRRLGLGALPSPDVVLDPWPPSLRLPHARGHLGLRHVAYDGAAVLPDWILRPGEKPRICMTLGTVVPRMATCPMADLVRGILTGLAGLGCELVAAVDDDLATRLQPLPDAVLHAGRVPLSATVRNCAVAIHHGGNGSSLAALAAGVPQLVLPAFDDQIENAEAIVRSGAGLSLPQDNMTPENVVASCERLLGEPSFAASASDIAREILAQPSPIAIAAVLELLARRHPDAISGVAA